MSVEALGLIMLFIERAPFSLEVECIEVERLVFWEQQMKQSDFDVVYRMRERAIDSVLALFYVRTELGLVFFWVIESFDTVVSLSA